MAPALIIFIKPMIQAGSGGNITIKEDIPANIPPANKKFFCTTQPVKLAQQRSKHHPINALVKNKTST